MAKRKLYSSVNKNIVRTSNLLQDASTAQTVAIATAVTDVTVGSTLQVEAGKYIQAINFEINFNNEGSITQIIDWYIWKNTQGTLTRVAPNVTGLSADISRRNRVLEGMEMPSGINNSQAIKRIGTVLIPKHMQKMGLSDQWEFVYIASSTGTVDVCGKFIYKVKEPA